MGRFERKVALITGGARGQGRSHALALRSAVWKLGTNLPEHLIGKDPGALAEFLGALEELGHGYVTKALG